MKRILYLLLMLAALVSCHKDIWDKLNDHEARIAKLELFCNQLNTNINSLQALVNAINTRDYIKSVTPVMENGTVVGYTIIFNSSNPITIYHGKNGEDGHSPVIGIKQDEDGCYYWTLDGEWILSDGKKVRAEGSGRDGITPQLKIEEEYWWVSYDESVTWSKLGKAVSDWGDSMFKEVRQDDRYVYFVLAYGEEIKISKGGLHWEYV